ncbi:aminotransferase class III-fold pyridoxal phosphate-dependent enzyme [Wenzhouxiangella marina]|uniref:Lysine 6-aminotransferase n=1 Tax=Wenzhouxiangella marina TaxID=1579979 RepID=A0A0K0XX06_9GAMM|nr:aminotransferase class III-fold pyridoxal phosphate-dependent enzyme [Wenzhouxiangella marina]AKS42219.1 lysine 6-aminotransferase [Wenzhouxiangella marina]MBB6086009.1 acetylornithine/succinyldiaminopimelate/putrescine aminotransferase [Wenzhouxiangella marina]
MAILSKLEKLRSIGGKPMTRGLSDELISRFAERDPRLEQAVDDALGVIECWQSAYPDLIKADEAEQKDALQAAYVNFYADDAVNPYVALAGRGPWIITAKGAVLHDSGGYGMLGFGHAPEKILQTMAQPHVMANVMTPCFSHLRFAEVLRAEIGQRRADGCPYHRFLCMNSGSESVTVAGRIADINAKTMTDPGAAKAGYKIKRLSLSGGFHGRTDRPARFSDSTRKTYVAHLASFRDDDSLMTVEPNNCEQLRALFQHADEQKIFIEAMFMEPVMGEGNPGAAITPEFYALARELTRAHGSLLLVDSIQAGLRTQGVLSIVDYPGFEGLEAPDMETYSKALNAGQYPLSVLAMNERAAGIYRKGVYGNTMTTNPRALDVGTAVLQSITPELRRNIVERGEEFVRKFKALQDELDGRITQVQGTGLLFSVELDNRRYKAYGSNSTEEYLRMHGINVIHGGENSLRYTPTFGTTSEEVDMIVEATRDALLNGPVKAIEEAA